jgi:integrase
VSKEQKRARRASANRVLTTLKAALNRAFRAGLTDDDTAWRRIKPFERVTTQRPGFLLLHECKRLINASEGDFRTLVHAALLTGARYGELRNLLVRDCALGKVHVRKSKSGRPRHIVLTEEGVRFFTQLSAGRAGDEWLLLRAGRQWNKSEQARPMRAACLRAAITPPIGFHQLRHSYASLSVMADMPLPVLARNLGHASTRMIEQHYGHMRADFVDEAIKAAAPRFGMVGKTNVRPL